MARLKIGVVVGSTRKSRFGDKPAKWIADIAAARGDLDIEILDLRDYPMPFFDEVASSIRAPSRNEIAFAWQTKVASLDGYIFTAAEYNRGPTAVLKNALDYAYDEWNNKPAAFVGYGGVGGARAVEQLRLHAVELQMAPIRNAVHIAWTDLWACGTAARHSPTCPIWAQRRRRCSTSSPGGRRNALKAARESDAEEFESRLDPALGAGPLGNHLVDAAVVEIDHFEAPPLRFEFLARDRDVVEM